jgi:hypothetical protein
MLPPLEDTDSIPHAVDALVAKVAAGLHSESYAAVTLASISVVPALLFLFYFLSSRDDYHRVGSCFGLCVLLQGLVLRTTYAPHPASLGNFMTGVTILYGTRLLASRWYSRDTVVLQSSKTTAESSSKAMMGPLPLSLLLSLTTEACSIATFSAFMMCPVFYLFLWPPPASEPSVLIALSWVGALTSWMGLMLEAVSEAHSFFLTLRQQFGFISPKNQLGAAPHGGVYRVFRRPVYAGEIMMWLGVWIAGLPSFLLSSSKVLASSRTWTAATVFLGASSLVLAVGFAGRNPFQPHRHACSSSRTAAPDDKVPLPFWGLKEWPSMGM